jgi:hypothetical protein
MKAELVENLKGEKRILLTSENAEERALIKAIGNAGTAVVLVTGSEKEPGKPTEHHISLVAGEREINDESEDEDERAYFDELDDEDDDQFDEDDDRFEGTLR